MRRECIIRQPKGQQQVVCWCQASPAARTHQLQRIGVQELHTSLKHWESVLTPNTRSIACCTTSVTGQGCQAVAAAVRPCGSGAGMLGGMADRHLMNLTIHGLSSAGRLLAQPSRHSHGGNAVEQVELAEPISCDSSSSHAEASIISEGSAGGVMHSCTTQQHIRARLRRMQQRRQQAVMPQEPAACGVLVVGAHSSNSTAAPAAPAAADGMETRQNVLAVQLAAHQQQYLQQRMIVVSSETSVGSFSTWLDRKLTSILTDCISWQDVADVLAAADSSGRLNGLHVAAAAARLARLAAAERAAATVAAGSSGAQGESALVSGVVPQTKQQLYRMQTVRAAVAAAADSGWSSRWHLPDEWQNARGTAAGHRKPDCKQAGQQQQQYSEHVNMTGHHTSRDDCHGSSTWCAAARPEGLQHLLDELSQSVAAFWPSMSAGSMTSSCWALAVLGQPLPAGLLPEVGAALMHMAHCLEARPDSCSCDELPHKLVVLLWSLARLSVDPPELQPCQHTYSSCTAAPEQEQHSSLQQHAQEWQPGDEVALQEPMQCCSGQQEQQQASDWSGSSCGSVVDMVLGALVPHMPALTGQGVAMLMWALGSWRWPLPGEAAAALLQVSGRLLMAGAADVSPAGLAVLLWSVARLGLCPSPDWLAAWLAAMRVALPAASSHDCAMSVWALATLGVAPPGEWLGAVCKRAGAHAAVMAPAELPVLLWGLSRLRFRPPLAVAQVLLARGMQLAAGGLLSPQGLALLLWAPAAQGLAPRSGWVDGVLAAAAAYLPLFRAVEASGLMVGLVRLQHIPPDHWMEAWWRETEALLHTAGGRQLVLLLWAAVQLGQAPPAAWFAAWQAATTRAMAAGQLTGQAYGIMWGALQQLEVALQQDWLQAYWQASMQVEVLAGMDCLAAERTLAGLASVTAQLPVGVRPPRHWTAGFLAATQHNMQWSNINNIAGMLAAAGRLQLVLPRPWLDAAMARLAALLAAQGVLDSSSSGLGNMSTQGGNSRGRAQLSLALAARLHRRRLAAQLRQVLAGLRAQQMMTAAARPGRQVQQQQQQAAAAFGVGDAVSAWPWLEEAVLLTWPDRQTARQALTALTGSDKLHTGSSGA